MAGYRHVDSKDFAVSLRISGAIYVDRFMDTSKPCDV